MTQWQIYDNSKPPIQNYLNLAQSKSWVELCERAKMPMIKEYEDDVAIRENKNKNARDNVWKNFVSFLPKVNQPIWAKPHLDVSKLTTLVSSSFYLLSNVYVEVTLT